MTKRVLLLIILNTLFYQVKADHITGGEMYYMISGNANGEIQYTVTLKFYMRCNSGRQFNNPNYIGVYNRQTNQFVKSLSVQLTGTDEISLPLNDPCISNPPTVCYNIGFYVFTVSLPPSSDGYLLSSMVNYRIAGINNLAHGYSQVGATYTCEIPGTSVVANAPQNNSAKFVGDDLVIVCAENNFSYSFAATDMDGDQLRYSFCGAYNSSSPGNNNQPMPPPYNYVPYGSGYSESVPLGNSVSINQNTGLITGVAPQAGVYVVTVCVQEIRNGQVIATQRKDLQIFIAPCSIAAAQLEPEYLLCTDTRSITLSNGSNSSLIHTYNWRLFDQAGSLLFTGNNPTAYYTFADTGVYRVSLIINPGEQCNDSATALVRVYPGLVTDFSVSGICISKPTLFQDQSTNIYGTINSWNWDFGEPASVTDFSVQRNPSYTYPAQGTKQVQLMVSTTKGCRDTLTKTISIVDKPPVTLGFRDTLICVNDQVQLLASSNGGTFRWSPTTAMNQPDSPNPTVSPLVTTTYTVQLDDNGCRNQDSVRVRVTDHVELSAMADTTICQGDTIRLRIISDGQRFTWSPIVQVLDPGLSSPRVVTPASSSYQLTASIGGCIATEEIFVKTVPYPSAFAGNDITICYGNSVQLHAQSNGSSYQWLPGASLDAATILDPLAKPSVSTNYLLLAYDTRGCPKPGRDTVLITVTPPIHASAGRDTAVIAGQPLQLQATGGDSYQWFPSTYLSAPDVSNPVASFSSETFIFRYKVVVFKEGCLDSAFVSVKIFKTPPTIFVPTAFTPNYDGRNDMLRPLGAGIDKIEYFRVFNRWGQLVFSSNNSQNGWDGRISGREQGSGTFIWMVKAVDYLGNPYFQKGTVTVIR